MSNYLNNNKIKNVHRFKLIFVLVIIIFLIRWQVIDAAKFEKIKEGRVYSSQIDSLRGSIYAKDGTSLAYSEPRFDLYIWMDDLEYFEKNHLQTREEFIKKVATVLQVENSSLEQQIEHNTKTLKVKWFRIAKSLTSEQWTQLNNLKTSNGRIMRGIAFVNTSVRRYPEGNIAAHLIGLTNVYEETYTYGVSGLEGAWNGVLNPKKGLYIQEDNAVGEVVTNSLIPTIEPKQGSSIYTSIDKKLQSIIQEKIAKGVEDYDADSGTIIVMDPKTSQILALANYPSYDPNERKGEAKVFGNIAITEPYETGSTGKVLTIAAAVDLGLITPDTIIMPNGHQGCEKIHRDLQPLCTWDKRPQAPMPAKDCFAKSDNICFFHIAELMDKRDFNKYLQSFGVGTPSGVDLKGESYGLLKNVGLWNTGDVAAFSYGHGYLLNAVQSINTVAAIANYGVRMQPYVVTKVVAEDGKVNEYRPISLNRVVSQTSAETVTQMMRQIFLNSIAPNEYYYYDLKNYDIALKSGTALIANSQGYSTNINATYIGFDASESRTFVLLVKLENPKIPSYDRLAFYNARYVWLDTFAAIKDHLNVPTK